MSKVLWLSAAALMVSTSSASGQSQSRPSVEEPGTLPGMVSGFGFIQDPSQRVVIPRSKTAKINLRVVDSPLKYIAFEVARQAGLSIIGFSSGPLADTRMTVNLVDATLTEAFETVLAGTGLAARLSEEGETIVIYRLPTGRKPSDKQEIQRGSLTGRILDSATQQPLSGVTVFVNGESLQVVSDKDGNFRFPGVPAGPRSVTVRLFGYQTQTKVVTVEGGKSAALNFTMVNVPTSLNEVLTTATGEQRRVEISSDIIRIDPEVMLKRAPVRSVTEMIEAAQVPGVLITRSSGDPGSSSRIRMRGIGSITQSNEPVVIVDGVWIDPGVGRPSRFDLLDPQSIEKIEIIRGPSAATLYGQDASNGIIVVTTKSGQIGPNRWNVSYSSDWGKPYGSKPLIYDATGIAMESNRSMSCGIDQVLRGLCVQESIQVYDPNHRLLGTEGHESSNRYSVELDGGTSMMRYHISGSAENRVGARRTRPIDALRMGQFGGVIPSKFNRPSKLSTRTIASTFTLSPSEVWTAAIRLQGSQSLLTDNRFEHRYITSGGLSHALSVDTIAVTEFSNIGFTRRSTPMESQSALLNAQVTWRPHPKWNVMSTAGVERTVGESETSEATVSCTLARTCQDTLGRRSQVSESRLVNTFRLNANYSPDFGWMGSFLELRPSIGGDFRKNSNTRLSAGRSGLPPGQTGLAGGELSDASYNSLNNATAGWYLNTTVGLFRRLYFDVGIRQDIGSAITSSRNSRYPKLGTSWLVSDENFWPQNNFVGLLRLRAAMGHSAVQPTLADVRGQYISNYAFLDGQWVPSYRQQAAGNNSLKSERATELELGFDTDLLWNRIDVVINLAMLQNRNNLVRRSLPPSVSPGGTGRFENIARVENKSLEIMANGRALESDNYRLELSIGATFTENKVARLGDGVSPFNATASGRIQEGYPIAGVWEPVVMGYFDSNNDGLLSPNEIIFSDSVRYLGWSQPRVRTSYGLSFTLRNQLTFDSRLAYQSRYVQSYTATDGYLPGMIDVNASLADQAQARSAEHARRPISDLRWNSASVTYQVPQHLLGRISARTLSVSLQGSNLGLWTNYIGRDPGVNSTAFARETISDNGRIMPSPRLYSLQIRWGL